MAVLSGEDDSVMPGCLHAQRRYADVRTHLSQNCALLQAESGDRVTRHARLLPFRDRHEALRV